MNIVVSFSTSVCLLLSLLYFNMLSKKDKTLREAHQTDIQSKEALKSTSLETSKGKHRGELQLERSWPVDRPSRTPDQRFCFPSHMPDVIDFGSYPVRELKPGECVCGFLYMDEQGRCCRCLRGYYEMERPEEACQIPVEIKGPF
eukprot:g19724.t1